MSVVVEHDHELYSLMIDKVADVIAIENAQIKDTPPTLDEVWQDISNGIYRMDGRLLLLMDVSKLLGSVS
jgi:purine-binding chemotaxis protein CheW